jgi:hypothetical protein
MPARTAPSTGEEAGNTAQKKRRQKADRRRTCTAGVYTAKAIRNESQKVGQVTSYRSAGTLVVRCLSKIQPDHYRLSREKKLTGDKLRKRNKFQKAPSCNKGKQADLYVTRIGVRGFKPAPSDTNKSLPVGYRSKATTQARASHFVSQPHLTYRTMPQRSTTLREASSRFQ